MRALVIPLALILAPAPLAAAPARRPAPKPAPRTPEQREADRHFKSGVALFKDGKYAEALAEFERAYEIAPHPLVLYNIAGCHRQLSHYAEAVTYYRRFLTEGKGAVSAERLSGAQAELDAILALVARVTVTVSPADDGATLTVDGSPLDHPEMPLILPPGEHRLTAHAPGRPDAERSVRVASGDTVTIDLVIPAAPPAPAPVTGGPSATALIAPRTPAPAEPPHRRFAIGAGFGTNLRLAGDTGAPSISIAAGLGSRVDLGVDVVMVAYAVVPAVRIRLFGDALALHAIGAVPIALTDGSSSDRFAAAAFGFGLRYRPLPSFAIRLESYAAFAGKMHGTSIPAFLGGELWF
ncbi:MAG TPA: tetratricopeptide repeat protein [Kofleriaceae bacterium]|jgi:hypothetical protein|nr:tetratricopeptide repeat protein [Kofleriaceae bacterium]